METSHYSFDGREYCSYCGRELRRTGKGYESCGCSDAKKEVMIRDEIESLMNLICGYYQELPEKRDHQRVYIHYQFSEDQVKKLEGFLKDVPEKVEDLIYGIPEEDVSGYIVYDSGGIKMVGGKFMGGKFYILGDKELDKNIIGIIPYKKHE